MSTLDAPAMGEDGASAEPCDARGNSPARTGLAHAVIATYDAYPTADFATNAARVAHRERTDELVAKALGMLDACTAPARLEAAGIACARLRDLHDLVEHPQPAAREG